MAVTVTPVAAGNNSKRWRVTFALDADTTATIAHGLIDAPNFVIGPSPLNAQAYVGQVARTTVDATNIVLTKNTAVGSGGAVVEVIAFRPGFGL